MGMSFRPPSTAAQVMLDLKQLAPAPLEESFRAMMAQVLSVGTFHGSLDYDGQFETAYVTNNIQTATHQVTRVVCSLRDNNASLTAPQMTPGKLVRKVLDPVLSDVFQFCPSWALDQTDGDIWMSRMALDNGLNIIVEVRAPLSQPIEGEATGAFALIEVLAMN